jgi:8-oxo-dGTP diphosphatase
MRDKPIVVVAVIVRKPDQTCLMGRRKGGSLDGKWCFPGGKVEYMETLSYTCVREVAEETGILLSSEPKFWTFTESFHPVDGGHMLGMVFTVSVDMNIQAELAEPHKFYEWKWFRWEEIPKQSMTVINGLVAAHPLFPAL